MNQTIQPIFQITGNICVAIAALLYAVPLQILLWEFAHKRNDGPGGALAGLLILIPLWLLLLGGLLCVTASSGFEWVRVLCATVSGGAGWLRFFMHPVLLTIAATFALAVVSFLFMGMTPQSGIMERILVCAPIYLFPFVTMLLVLLSLNPRLDLVVPLPVFRFSWIIFAALSLTVCVGFVGYRLVRTGVDSVAGITHGFHSAGPSNAKILAKIPTLDPQHDFAELLQRAQPFESRTVREAAAARLRTNPNFIEALAADLNSRGPSRSLAFVESATFSPDELAKLALPTRKAIERFTYDILPPNYMTSQQRKKLLRWGKESLPALVKKFAGTDVDFAPTFAAYEQALAQEERR